MYWKRWRRSNGPTDEDLQKQMEALRSAVSVPTLWLFGKTGSGKSSIIKHLTGADDAVVGQGYRPETKHSRRFEFPNGDEPILRFLDTRGIGEALYDPQEDIATFSESTHLIIVTVRVADHALDCIVEPLRKIRQQSPSRPILLALTCLHQSTSNQDITSQSELDLTSGPIGIESREIPDDLKRQIQAKLKQFHGLFDASVAIDLTPSEDGFDNPAYGTKSLKESILRLLPHAYRQTMLTLDAASQPFASEKYRKAHWQILASSTLAATAGAVPLPWVNIPVVLAIQSRMAIKIALIYEQEMTSKHWATLSSAAGTQLAVRLAARELLKFVPVVGMAVGAAGAFAFTYALGMACNWYFSVQCQGIVPSTEELKKVFSEQLVRGQKLWGNEGK